MDQPRILPTFVSLVFLLVGLSGGMPASAQDQCKPVGWATRTGRSSTPFDVTGGGDAVPVVVKTFADLQKYATDDQPRVIHIDGTLGSGWSGTTGDMLQVRSNKTIVGLRPGTRLNAVIRISGNYGNIVIRNLVIQGPGSNADQAWDDIVIQNGAHNVWIDHCEFWNGQDGNADVVKGADNVTFTWCIFGYTIDAAHNLSNLIGSSDDEPESHGKLNVTIADSWFKNVSQRQPRCRYGQIHAMNNLYSNDVSVHASESGVTNGFMCTVRSENNHFIGIKAPVDLSKQAGTGSVHESVGNAFEGCSGNQTGSGSSFAPPYEYKSFLTPASSVKSLVQSKAGATLASPTACVAAPTAPSLRLASGSADQSVESGSTIEPMVFSWGGTATGAATTTLPTGLSSKVSGQTLVVSGVPTGSGTFEVATIQGAGTAVKLSGRVTVYPVSNLKVAATDFCDGLGVVESKNPGADQAEYFNPDNTSGAFGKWVFHAEAAGPVDLVVRYANGGAAPRPMTVSVGGSSAGTLAFPASGSWSDWRMEVRSLDLAQGRNEVVLTATTSDGGPNLDWLGIVGKGLSREACTSVRAVSASPNSGLEQRGRTLVVRKAGSARASLYLFDLEGQRVLQAKTADRATEVVFDLSEKGLPDGLFLAHLVLDGVPTSTLVIRLQR